MMLGIFNKIIGNVSAVENKKNITLYGFNGLALRGAIENIWRTSKISSNIFSTCSSTKVSFHKFFLIDIIYTLETIGEQNNRYLPKRQVVKAIDELKKLTDLRTVFNDSKMPKLVDRSHLSKFKLTPLPWQDEYIDRYGDVIQRYKLNGHLLAAAAGNGKSIGSLMVMECLGVDTIFIVSPKNAVIDVWEETFTNKYRNKVKYWSTLGDKPLSKGYDKYILHYEYLPKFLEFLRSQSRSTFGKVGIVVDECCHPDTEVLTPTGYKKISAVSTEDYILQYNQDGTNEWVKPLRVIKKPTNEVHHYHGRKWEQVVTPNHRMVYTLNGNIEESLSKDFIPDKAKKVITSGKLVNGTISQDINFNLSSVDLLDKGYTWCREFIDSLYNKVYCCDDEYKANIVQLIAVNAGYTTTYSETDGVYTVKIITDDEDDTCTKIVTHLDTPVDFYCVTVPSGMFYTRYNNKVSVTGNCHNFNDIRSNRTETLVTLTKEFNIDFSIWMSGTPLKAFGKECVPLLSCIDPLFDRECKERFLGVFGNSSDRALDILANRVGIISHKVDKAAVMEDYKIHHYQAKVTLKNGDKYTISHIRKLMTDYIVERTNYYKENMHKYEQDYLEGVQYYRDTIANSPIQLKELEKYTTIINNIRKKGYDPVLMKEEGIFCNKFEKNVIIPRLPNDLKRSFRKSKSVYKYVQLTIMGECLGGVLGKARTQCNVDIATNLGTMELIPEHDDSPQLGKQTLYDIIDGADKKTLIFTSFVEVVNKLAALLESNNYKPLRVYGETNKDLSNIVDKYSKDDEANPLIATFQSLSTAVPLTMANTTIMLNSPFRDHEYKQAVARTYRKGQDKDVIVIDVLLDTGEEDNISTRSKDIAEQTAAIVAKIMGYDKVDLSALSSESCATCTSGYPYTTDSNYDNVSFTHDYAMKNNMWDGYKKKPISQGEDDSEPYYKTDLGEKVDRLTETARVLLEEEVSEDPDTKVVLSDIVNDKLTHNTKYTKKKSYQW